MSLGMILCPLPAGLQDWRFWLFLLPGDGRAAFTDSFNLVVVKVPPLGAGSLCGLRESLVLAQHGGVEPAVREVQVRSQQTRWRGIHVKDGFLPARGGASEGCIGRGPWRIGGLWVCRTRGAGVQAGEQTWEGTSELGPGFTAWIAVC